MKVLFVFLPYADAGVFRILHRPLVPENTSSELIHPTLEHSSVGKFVASGPKIKVRAAHTINHRDSSGKVTKGSKVLAVQCFQPFPGPGPDTRCPDECPYMRFDPDRMCHFKCITREWCLTAPNMPTSFPDDDMGRCHTCSVPGCRKCMSPTKCVEGECMEGFDMVDGACQPRSRNVWRAIFIVIGCVVLIAAIYLAVIWRRPIRQSMRLKLAQQYRSMSKLRSPSQGHKFYSLSTNLCKEPVSGIGILLHFRFQFFWLTWALMVLISAGLLSFYHGRFKASDTLAMVPTHEEVFQQCEKFDTENAFQVYAIQRNFRILTVAVYVATTLAVISFAIWQRRAFRRQEDLRVDMEDFALCVYRMPIEKARDSLEDEYTQFFRSHWDGVVGVSISWDYADKEPEVITAVATHMHDNVERAHTKQFLTDEELRVLLDESDKSKQGLEAYRKRRERCCLDPEMRCLDDKILGTAQASDAGEVFTASKANIQELLSGLSTTGFVFVVFQSQEKRDAVLSKGELPQYKDAQLKLSMEVVDPLNIIWTGFAVHKSERNANIVRGIFITLGVIVVWAVCFYGPYVVYIMSWSSVAGQTSGDGTTMQLLGIMCAIGNQVVYFTCGKVADSAGFRSRDYANTFNCCLYTVAVLINIIVDVSLMVVMAHGYQQDSGMDPTATIRNPSFSYSLFLQMVGYLYPSTLLLPYLAEPFPMNIIPYFLGKWLVRSAIRISRYEAEQALVCPEFDLLRYGDILINVSTVIVCFFLASSSLWWIFMWLFVSNGLIYLWDHFRLLRQCEEEYFANDLMEKCSQYISALPCALLAAAVAFKSAEGRELLRSFKVRSARIAKGMQEDLMDHLRELHASDFSDVSQNMWLVVIGAFIGHIVVHLLLVKYIIPKMVPPNSGVGPESAETYQECASRVPCCWFKSNPVHCLRSQNLRNHDPPLVYYVRGKEYLHKKNIACDQHYEEPEFVKEESMDEGLKKAFGNLKTGLTEKMSETLHYKRGTTTSKLGCVGKPSAGTEHNDDDTLEKGSCSVQ